MSHTQSPVFQLCRSFFSLCRTRFHLSQTRFYFMSCITRKLHHHIPVLSTYCTVYIYRETRSSFLSSPLRPWSLRVWHFVFRLSVAVTTQRLTASSLQVRTAFSVWKKTNGTRILALKGHELVLSDSQVHEGCLPRARCHDASLTFFRADSVEVSGWKPSSEGSMEPLVSSLLVFDRLLVERDRLLQRLICTHVKAHMILIHNIN